MTRALHRWRTHAWAVVGNPNYPLSTQRLAWRFLVQHGLA